LSYWGLNFIVQPLIFIAAIKNYSIKYAHREIWNTADLVKVGQGLAKTWWGCKKL